MLWRIRVNFDPMHRKRWKDHNDIEKDLNSMGKGQNKIDPDQITTGIDQIRKDK